MIPAEARYQFHEIITHEMFETDRALSDTLDGTIAAMTSRGLLRSGPAMKALTRDATNSLKARSQFIFGQLLRCLAAHQAYLDDETTSEAVTLLRQTIEAQAHVMRSRLFSMSPFTAPGLESALRQLQAQFDQEAPRIITRLTAELRLTAQASRIPPDAAGGGSTVLINGPVGLVQTGEGSQATINQHIDAGLQEEVVRVLQVLIEQLDKAGSASIPGRDDLRELVAETQAEARKQSPNKLKLGSGLRTIAETTKFVGSLGPAYQVLKPLLSFFGVHLP